MKYVIAVCCLGIGFIAGDYTHEVRSDWIASKVKAEVVQEAVSKAGEFNCRTNWRAPSQRYNCQFICPSIESLDIKSICEKVSF